MTINIGGPLAIGTLGVFIDSPAESDVRVDVDYHNELYTGTLDPDTAALSPTGDAGLYLDEFGVAGQYKPIGGGTRDIICILDYEEPDDLASGLTPRIKISVANDSTTGISTDEVDLGGDIFSVAVRIGESPQDRRILDVITQDESMVTYLIR